MVELSLFSHWSHCSHCGLPPGPNPDSLNPNAETTTTDRPCKGTKKLMACADCSCVAYHDATCQQAHWKSSHKKQCKGLARAMLPLKELIRWNKMHKEAKKQTSDAVGSAPRDALAERGASVAASRGRRAWCWWEPDNENGITDAALRASHDLWRRGVQKWDDGAILAAVRDLQASLEPYRRAWPYVGRSSGTDEGRDEARECFARGLALARRLLFCGYCELDAGDAGGARQRLVQCLSIALTLCATDASRGPRQGLRAVLHDAWMELMLSMEEVPQDRPIARHVASMAIATHSCGWVDPLQRPGFMADGLSSVPFIPPDQHPPWCQLLEHHWMDILNEYNHLMTDPSNFSDVGSGRRGSGHEDGTVVSGISWKEYVLFGTGAAAHDADAPFTKRLLRRAVPDAVSLAERGGGEVIFSRLAPRTRIAPHCGPTNLRWTAHLGLVVPGSAADCRLRVGDAWHAWTRGGVTLFDDSYEHEVRNDTDEPRVVLLLRVWHPGLPPGPRRSVLSQAMQRKEDAVLKRFHPPR